MTMSGPLQNSSRPPSSGPLPHAPATAPEAHAPEQSPVMVTDDAYVGSHQEPCPSEEPPPKKKKDRGIPKEALIIGGIIVGLGLLFGGKKKEKAEEPAPAPEPPKAEPPKAEPPKAEPPKAEPPAPKPPAPKPPAPKPPAPKPPVVQAPPVPTRTFQTKGDPVVRTADGLSFSVNLPGVYTSLKSSEGDFVMQQKVSHTKDDRHYNTGMAFKMGQDRIAFDAQGGEAAATMTINGEPVKLGFKPLAMKLPDGGELKYDPRKNVVTITSTRGDVVTVHRAWNKEGTHYLNAKVKLAESREAGTVAGVLGALDDDADRANDARMRDGSTYQGPLGSLWRTPEDFLAEWRSRPEEALL